ncbi:MAG: hypothetical protein U0168_28690 [Nannocystaceae bacterium]
MQEDKKEPEKVVEEEKKDDLAEEDEDKKVVEKEKPKVEQKVLKDKPEKFSAQAMSEGPQRRWRACWAPGWPGRGHCVRRHQLDREWKSRRAVRPA